MRRHDWYVLICWIVTFVLAMATGILLSKPH